MNGSVWVWPLWFYVKASFDLGGREFLPRAEELLARFGEEIQSYGNFFCRPGQAGVEVAGRGDRCFAKSNKLRNET